VSEASQQAQDIRDLAEAVLKAREEVEKAEKASKDYAEAVKDGSAIISKSRAAELEAARAVANAAKSDAEAALGARAQAQAQRNAAGAVSLRGIGSAATAVAGSMGAMAAAAGIAYAALSQATAEYARHDRALRLLGNSYAAVERATNGAMSAEEALNLQGQIQTAGVRVNAEQLGLLARAAREYALATGNDASQAVEKLSNAIVNNSEDALSELNLAQARSTNSAQTLANMTQLLAERYRGLAPTAQQADERVQSFERAAKEAGNTLLTVVARGAEGALGALFSLGGGSESVTQTLKDMSREVRDLMNSTGEASVAAVQAAARARSQFEIDRRAFQSSSMLSGSGLTIPQASQLNDAERQSITQLFGEASRLSNEVFQQRLREILELHEKNAQASRDEREQTEANARARREGAELNALLEKEGREDRLRHQGDELGMLRRQAEQLGIRLNMQQAAITPQQRLNFLQRELGRLLQDEERNRADIAKNLREQVQIRSAQVQHSATDARQAAREREELRRVAQELNELYGDADRLEAKIQTVDRRAGEGAIEWLRRRVEAQRAVNTAAEEGLQTAKEDLALLQDKAEAEADRARAAQDEANQREIDNARAKEAAAAELNAHAVALRRADELEQRMRESFGLAQEQAMTTTQAMASGAKNATDAFGELAKGIIDAGLASAANGTDAGAAIAKYVDEWAAAKAVQWGLQSVEALASAGIAYFIRPDAVPGLLASAASFAGLAAVAGITAAAIPNAPAASSGSGAGGGDRLASSSRSERAMESKGAPAMVFNVSGFTSTESAQEGIVRALQDAQRRGILPGGSLR